MLEVVADQRNFHIDSSKLYHRKTKSETVENGSRSGSPSYLGNMLIRRQYFGSMEMIPVQAESNSPLLRKASRFRVEPSDDVKFTQLIARSPSLAKLENPEFQTRWYFKFFLGQVHSNYVFVDSNKETYALSICLTDVENHGIPQYRAILWQKSGCRRISFPYVPNKSNSAREVLRFFGMDKLEKTPKEIVAPEVQKELLVLEEQEGSVNFKFGVIYAKHGQSTDDEMFGNESGSEEFENFLHVLGDTVDLKGWTGYRGGLDVKDNMTGINSLYTMFEGHEVMFHVSVMLPYSKDTQQVERKRHIGNDIAVIVFVDGEPEEELAFKPSSIRTKFTHVFAVIRYSKKNKSYWLSVYSEENVPVFGPPLPVPARFVNPQEFRSFLLTKLMNGEKAAYVSPVFSHKRQRTLESLIKGLQNDQWAKVEKFGIKRAMSDQINSIERRRAFLEVGQSLKVNKIMQGHAPTSVNNVGGLLAVKNTPWDPQPVLSNFPRKIICGDSFGNSLVVSCDLGIYHITDSGARHIFDRSMTADQINVMDEYGIFVVRVKKNGRIYVIPLTELANERPFTVCRRQCAKYYLKKSKGCHVYSISRPESPFLALALAAGKRISLFYWEESSIWYQKENSKIPDAPPARFASEKDFYVNESPRTITIVHDINDQLLLCIGLRQRFDVINVQTKQVSVLKSIINYRKPKIVSALDVFDEEKPELLLTYSHTSVFVTLREGLSEVVSFHWNHAPINIVCAFPFILGFSENNIEIRLMVNGNLVHTHCVPRLKLITAKEDIYFTSTVTTESPVNIKKRNSVSIQSQAFLKIGLSELAGLDALKNDEETDLDDIADVLRQRNIGVYEDHGDYKMNAINRLRVAGMPARTYSDSAAFCSPRDINEAEIHIHDSPLSSKETSPAHVTTTDSSHLNNSAPKTRSRSNSFVVKSKSSENLNKLDGHRMIISPSKSIENIDKVSERNVKKYSVNTDGAVPLWKLAQQNERTRSLPASPVNQLPQASFFYTSQKRFVKYQHSNSLARIERVGAKFIEKRTASVKSLPESVNASVTAKKSPQKAKRAQSIVVTSKYDTTSWDLSVTNSSTLPIHKKSTIV